MSVEEIALGLPRLEKLRLMEALWVDLNGQPEKIESPAWHEAALKETELRVAQGKELIIEWTDAKKQLTKGR